MWAYVKQQISPHSFPPLEAYKTDFVEAVRRYADARRHIVSRSVLPSSTSRHGLGVLSIQKSTPETDRKGAENAICESTSSPSHPPASPSVAMASSTVAAPAVSPISDEIASTVTADSAGTDADGESGDNSQTITSSATKEETEEAVVHPLAAFVALINDFRFAAASVDARKYLVQIPADVVLPKDLDRSCYICRDESGGSCLLNSSCQRHCICEACFMRGHSLNQLKSVLECGLCRSRANVMWTLT